MSTITTIILSAIGVIVTAILGPMIVEWWKLKLSKNTDTLKDSSEADEQISKKLEEIKDKYDADRITLIQFHNGGNFYPTGKSIKKFSIFYEIVNPNINMIQKHFQNIPVSLFSKVINYVYEHDILCFPDYNDTQTLINFNIANTNEISQSKSSYMFGIKTIEGKLIGIIGIAFVKDYRELSEAEKTDLSVQTSSIGAVLYDYLKK